MNLPSNAVLVFSFLLFAFLLPHCVSSFPFLIYKQLVRKEVFPIVAWNIANCSQSSKQWFHSCRTRSKFFRSLSNRNLTLTPVMNKKWFLTKIYWNDQFCSPFSRPNTESRLRRHCVWFLGRRHQQPPKTWSCNTSSATLRGHTKSRIQANSKLFAPKCFE